ncbi:MAG: FAD-binding oxidoreductase [Pseudorhodoplanes sp.]|nr:FAD-binding oxidoreductase [Pseudorhodoplanes sp.]
MATDDRDLRTGRTIWQRMRTPRVPHRRLTRNIDTDVLIIGAGITGAMIADALAGAGLSTVVVDKRRPLKGATSASTALVLYEIDTPLTKLSRKIGQDKAVRAWRRSRLALTALAARIEELGLADAAQRKTLYLAGDELNAKALKRERDARNAAGLESVFLGRTQLRQRFGIARAGALLGFGNLAVNPKTLTSALFDAACANGARVYAPAEIVDVSAARTRAVATTGDGHRIRCRTLVFATGYELPDCVPAKGHTIASTWVIATVPQRRVPWPEQCMIWEASDPYLYMRTTDDNRVICGGEDEEFSDDADRDALIERKTRLLQTRLGKLFPGLDTRIDFAWAASFGGSKTGLPTIGEIPGMRHCWAALGYGGNGITYSRIAAELLRTALTGGRDPDADLFAFGT